MVRSARPISGLPEIGTIDAQVGCSRPARASRTMGRLRCSRPWPVLQDGAARLLRTRMSAGRNSNCGFSPIIFSQDCQKERCQESCQCVRALTRHAGSSRHPRLDGDGRSKTWMASELGLARVPQDSIQCASRINPTNFIERIDDPTA